MSLSPGHLKTMKFGRESLPSGRLMLAAYAVQAKQPIFTCGVSSADALSLDNKISAREKPPIG